MMTRHEQTAHFTIDKYTQRLYTDIISTVLIKEVIMSPDSDLFDMEMEDRISGNNGFHPDPLDEECFIIYNDDEEEE